LIDFRQARSAFNVMAQIELRWLELDALSAWSTFEEFLAIIFSERQRDTCFEQKVVSQQRQCIRPLAVGFLLRSPALTVHSRTPCSPVL
jgi:hypothetical protein